jgi:DNA-binding NarL/FixJ family response regulator
MNTAESFLPGHPVKPHGPLIQFDRSAALHEAELHEIGDSLGRLTQRQRQILEKIVNGLPNKVIAMDLQISQRTVEKHREGIMHRMRVRSLAALVRRIVLYEAYAHGGDSVAVIGEYPVRNQ